MKILITGICGFTGSTLARELAKEGNEVCGLDNFLREGSRGNVEPLRKLGIRVEEGDIRNEADLAKMPKVDWVLDCAAEPSVLAGVGSGMGSYELMDHNLIGTIRVLELCKKIQAGFVLMSTSRVYSVAKLAAVKVEQKGDRRWEMEDGVVREREGRWQSEKRKAEKSEIAGLTSKGISEEFSTEPPVSLYGASKRCAELLAMEYGQAFGFPVWINRCGVLAGKGQFGKADQGIFSHWIRSWRENRPLRYIGFEGTGAQVRDCLHPVDLVPVLKKQMVAGAGDGRWKMGDGGVAGGGSLVTGKSPSKISDLPSATDGGGRVDPRICNFGGGVENSCSLRQLSEWCKKRFGPRKVESDPKPRPYDLPWVVLDSSRAKKIWDWEVQTRMEQIFEEIAGG
jgi:CDP-paratose 2-epimerase